MKSFIEFLIVYLSITFVVDAHVFGSPLVGRLPVLKRRVLLQNESLYIASLGRRDDYSCGSGNPCKNGACCGESGYCGYGPKYCGNGCSSNCDAHAECGQYSEPPNQECPLNACCSQFGFCGTTKDFCNDKCQSNCVEHPKPPGVGGPRMTLSKVIGYWEAWNDRSTCHPGKATDLPIDALTHVNYAFAYLDPQSFKITTMDAATPVSTFQDLADLKLLNPNLEIFVSIGGWTFSDNGTATQPVFGNIAQSATNRQTFANNVLQFLDSFGYDGVDIDWEYPGAPDRGGSKDDGANYVLMLEALRKTFDGSGRKLGITFTAPSSFWYLRWFDLPGMMKHANWVNLMSYDLHGIWDNSNPIGSIVQGHTNLTDIKLAVELFWRVNIPPSRISFGFGFYGRGFTLADPSCKTPGCPFSGGANPGPCTGTSGYLAYYEIQDILKNKKRDITPVYDKEAAVKYLAWNTNQWISYDDEETFKDKIEWADSIGFGGSLIWASDLDDYELTAHKALTGKKDIGTALSLAQTQKPFAAEIDASFGSNCYKEKNEFKQMCDVGYIKVGADKDGINCKGISDDLCGRIICCPKNSGMVNCMWRGSGGDCNGQCHPGEVTITGSSWGGKPGESSPTKRCSRGSKVFCCQANEFDSLTENCHWTTKCGDSCKSDEESIAYAYDRWGLATYSCNGYHYCCKKDNPIPFKDCHWVGKGDCADNTCDKTEVTLWTDVRGDIENGCAWHRKKSLCCKPNEDAVKEMTCDVDLCSYDPSLCDVNSDYDRVDGYARHIYVDIFDGQEYESLEERKYPGQSRKIIYRMGDATVSWMSRIYPATRKLLYRGDGSNTMMLRGAFGMASTVCSNIHIAFTKLEDLPKTGYQTEHYHEIQMSKWLLQTAYTGRLPDGNTMKAATLTASNIAAGWNKPYDVPLNKLVEVVTDQKDWFPPDCPSQRFGVINGDYGYRYSLLYVAAQLNAIKGRIFRNVNPLSEAKLKQLLDTAIAGGSDAGSAIKTIIEVLQMTFGVFEYINDSSIASTIDRTRADQRREIQNMENHISELRGIAAVWDEFEPAYYAMVSARATRFVLFTTSYITLRLGQTYVNSDLARLAWTAAQLSYKIDRLVVQTGSIG